MLALITVCLNESCFLSSVLLYHLCAVFVFVLFFIIVSFMHGVSSDNKATNSHVTRCTWLLILMSSSCNIHHTYCNQNIVKPYQSNCLNITLLFCYPIEVHETAVVLCLMSTGHKYPALESQSVLSSPHHCMIRLHIPSVSDPGIKPGLPVQKVRNSCFVGKCGRSAINGVKILVIQQSLREFSV